MGNTRYVDVLKGKAYTAKTTASGRSATSELASAGHARLTAFPNFLISIDTVDQRPSIFKHLVQPSEE